MYIKKEDRQPQFEFVVSAFKRGIMHAVASRDKSSITYVMLRSAILAWIELGGGYNNGSDIKAILNDVSDEFTARVTHSLKGKRDKNGDIDHPLEVPSLDSLNLGKPTNIVGADGKPLKEDDGKGGIK